MPLSIHEAQVAEMLRSLSSLDHQSEVDVSLVQEEVETARQSLEVLRDFLSTSNSALPPADGSDDESVGFEVATPTPASTSAPASAPTPASRSLEVLRDFAPMFSIPLHPMPDAGIAMQTPKRTRSGQRWRIDHCQDLPKLQRLKKELQYRQNCRTSEHSVNHAYGAQSRPDFGSIIV
jgi:hypothetical protein